MQVSLADRDKQSMLFMGEPLNFTYDNPGPITVELTALSVEQKNQLLYNVRQGIVTVDDPQELVDSCHGFPAAQSNFTTPSELPIINSQPPTDALQQAAEERKRLKKILSGHHATVKKLTAKMRLAQVKTLLELEREGKNRKGLVNFFEDLVRKHEEDVARHTGTIDLKDMVDVYAKDVMAQRSSQISEVEDSEEREITLIPSDEELEQSS